MSLIPARKIPQNMAQKITQSLKLPPLDADGTTAKREAEEQLESDDGEGVRRNGMDGTTCREFIISHIWRISMQVLSRLFYASPVTFDEIQAISEFKSDRLDY